MQEIVASFEFVAFAALFVFFVEYLESVEVGLFEIFLVVGLELDQGLYIALDLAHHEV